MALNAYLKATGQTQGEIKGSVTQAGREDSMMVIGYSHEVVSPRDAATGLPTGKRQHSPLVVTKPLDAATPLLAKALVQNENLTEVSLRFYQPSRSGKEENHFTVKLTNANISQIQQEMLNNKYPENMKHEIREHVAFTYQKITWTWEGGVESEDSWAAAATRTR